MSIESWFRNNSDNSLLQRDKTTTIGFVGRSPDNNTIMKINNKLNNKLNNNKEFLKSL